MLSRRRRYFAELGTWNPSWTNSNTKCHTFPRVLAPTREGLWISSLRDLVHSSEGHKMRGGAPPVSQDRLENRTRKTRKITFFRHFGGMSQRGMNFSCKLSCWIRKRRAGLCEHSGGAKDPRWGKLWGMWFRVENWDGLDWGFSGQDRGWHMLMKFRDFRWNFHYDFSASFGPLHYTYTRVVQRLISQKRG